MSFEKYYRAELDYLRQLGRDAAEERPHLAAFLSEPGSDPDVERLLEGFAFLTGNLRAKIDDQFPELTHGLLNMLWPNYLRPTPSMTIIEYLPDERAFMSATKIPRGTQILSVPLDDTHSVAADDEPQGARCTFALCRDVWLFPMSISQLTLGSTSAEGGLNIHFSSASALNLHQLGLDKLRFYLGDDNYTSTQLYFWLSHYVTHAELVVNGVALPMPDFALVPVGFERQDALLPYPNNAYMGYRILQEYFCFSEGFMFFDVRGLNELPSGISVHEFSLNLHFSRALPADINLRPSSLRLHCVPAINLFQHDGEAFELDGTQSEYPLRVSYRHPERYDIFSVDRVESWLSANHAAPATVANKVQIYTAFEGFHHQSQREQTPDMLYYNVRIRPTPQEQGNGIDHFISFVRSEKATRGLARENISVSLSCTNRELPLRLRVGDINQPTQATPVGARLRNITRPSIPLYPLMDGSLHWSLLSNMSLNYMSLLDEDALKQILRTYDLPGMHNRQAARTSQKRLDAIERIESRPVDRLFKGVQISGLQSTLYLAQRAFHSEGELYLFSSVLARFFSLYANVNAFHELKVINLDNQECYEWPVQIGQHRLM